MPGYLRGNTNIKDNTGHAHIHSNKADMIRMIRMIMMAKWYSRNHEGLKLSEICLTDQEKPEKTLTQ